MATEPTQSPAPSAPPRRPWRAALLALVLAVPVLGGAGYLGGRHLWATYHFHQAERALERRDFKEAQAHLAVCLEIWPRGGRTHFLLARTARRSGDLVEAQRQLDLCRDLDVDSADLSFEQDLLAAQRGAMGPVERALVDRLQHNDEMAPLILEALAQGYAANHRASDALYIANQLLERIPDHLEGRHYRGWALEKLNHIPEAIDNYREALKIDPDCEWANLALGELLLLKQNPEVALEHFERVLRHSPDNPVLLFATARCRRELRQFDEAQKLIDQVLATGYLEYAVVRERGEIALDAGRVTEAESWLRRAYGLRPKDYETNFKLGVCLGRLHKDAESREFLARAEAIDAKRKHLHEMNGEVAKHPYDPQVRYETAKAAEEVGDDEQAMYWYQQALALNSRYTAAHLALADLLERHAQPAQAASHRRAAGR